MSFVFAPPAVVRVPVVGGAEFPVHRIYCVGRNYAEHAQEMGFTGREPPFFFLKPADAVVPVADGETGAVSYTHLDVYKRQARSSVASWLWLSGVPMVFVLAGTALLFAVLGFAMGSFDMALLGAVVPRVFSVMVSETLVAIPLFLFMGMMLERSKIAEELLEAMGGLFGSVRGGLAVSVSIVGALLAASTGIVGATTVTMGLMALPAMLRYGYSPTLACGSVCAAGTLGQIIPPSTVMVVMGEVLSAAYQQAQYAQGKFSVETVSVGQLFAGALIPGLLLVGIYIVYQLVLAWLRPAVAPAMPHVDHGNRRETLTRLLRVMVPPLVLIFAVLGSILGGVATPTEAAAIGAIGATLLSALRIAPASKRWVVATVVCIAVLVALAVAFDLRPGREGSTSADRVAPVSYTHLAAPPTPRRPR